MSSSSKVPADDGDSATQSKKLLKRLAKAQYRAQQKAERAIAAANGQDADVSGQRKRRSQRDCNRQGALKRLAAAADASGRRDEQPEIQYIACTSTACGGGNGADRRCQLRVVAPYVHRFETFVKARWCGRTLRDVFLNDFAGLSAEYCVRGAFSIVLCMYVDMYTDSASCISWSSLPAIRDRHWADPNQRPAERARVYTAQWGLSRTYHASARATRSHPECVVIIIS